jgi:hypothetical protein
LTRLVLLLMDTSLLLNYLSNFINELNQES